MKRHLRKVDRLPRSAVFATLFLAACGGGGSGDGTVDGTAPDSDDETLQPSLTDQVAHWSPTGVFLAAADCGQCHTASVPGDSPAVLRMPDLQVSANEPSPDGADISPFFDWKSTVMANAFTDPYFRANMAHEAETFPHLAGFIEDKCLTCHSPMARTHAHQTGVSLEQDASCLLNDGCYRAESAVEEPPAREGVSCTACHQITDSVLDGSGYPDGVHSGHYDIAAADEAGAFTIYGPYQSPSGNAMQNRVGFTPQYGLQMADSRQCASCHELYTPTIDVATDQPDGEDFPEQTPYTEWLNSDFGPQGSQTTSCQQCHMARPEVSDSFLTRIAVRPDGSVNLGWPERSPYSSHVMVGGNTWLLETLELFRGELGRETINAEGEFTAAADRTRAFLKTAASVTSANAGIAGNQLAFDLTIHNHSGHKLPTSFPARRMWLATRVTDAAGNVVFESGFPDDDHRLSLDETFTSEACLAAKKPAGFDSSGCYQPHINLVTASGDIPVYEVVLGATDDEITHILLYAAERLKDNRIPPVGFDDATVPEDIRPRGIGTDPNFNAVQLGQDTVAYRLAIPDSVSLPLSVESTLYYQSIKPTFIDGLHGEHPWVGEFAGAVEANPPKAETLASVSFQVQ